MGKECGEVEGGGVCHRIAKKEGKEKKEKETKEEQEQE